MNKSLLFAVACLTVASASAQRISEQANKNLPVLTAQKINYLQQKPQHLVAKEAPAGYFKNAPRKAKAAANVTAFYKRPAGSFYLIYDKSGSGYYFPAIQVKPFTDQVFENTSTGSAEPTYKWTYQQYDFSGSAPARKFFTSTDKNLTLNLIQEFDTVPSLEAKVGTTTNTYTLKGYQMDRSAASPTIVKTYPGLITSVATNTDFTGANDRLLAFSHFASGSNRQGTSKYAWTYYTGCLGPDKQTDDKGYGNGFWFGRNEGNVSGTLKPLNCIAAAYEKPAYPYVLHAVYAQVSELNVKADVTLTAKVYKLDSMKAYSDTTQATFTTQELANLENNLIASGTCTLTTADNADGYRLAEFVLQKDVEGLPMEIAPEIDSPILVAITGYNDANVTTLTFVKSTDDADEGFGELAFLGHADGTVPTDLTGLNNFFSSGEMKGALSIFLDVETPFLVYNKSNETGEYTVPAAGGSKSLEMYSYKSSADWNTTLADGSDLPDWVHITYTDGTGNDEGLVTANIKVDAYPAGQKGGRRADIKFGYDGAHLTYVVKQNDASGVEGIDANNATAYAHNGYFYVNANAQSDLNVYNVAGKLVKTAKVFQGQNSLDASDLADGVYFLNFNNQTVKVVK